MGRICSFVIVLCVMTAMPAFAQKLVPQDLGSLTMEDLMKIKVTGASKFLQDVREAPASITVVTADDIRRYGHRTLSDVLRSVRGIYTTYDRNYMYLGVRGMARPGDYNTRMLLLVDGHRLNDGIYDMAPVGTDFPIDLSLIDRVEVIRGPASSLYGTSAFFGVINVVTRGGSSRRGVQVEADGGTLGTGRVSASYGRLLGVDREVLVSATAYRSGGQSELFYPEFSDTPQLGIARERDGDRSTSLFGSYAAGPLSLRASFVNRSKDVPTGSYGTVFGDPRAATTDRRAFVDLTYDGAVGKHWSAVGRVGYDHYDYAGHYPSDYGLPEVVLLEDGSAGRVLSAELAMRRRIGSAHTLTAGFESRFQVTGHQWSRDDIFGVSLDINKRTNAFGAFVQDEIRLTPWMLATAGLRVDKLAGHGSRATPRAALVLLPRDGMSVKVLHGRAFRAPNAYEYNYYAAQAERPALDVERMSSTEIVWEQTFNRRVRATVSGFTYAVDDLISQRVDDSDDLDSLYFVNDEGMRGKGVELELESRFDNGIVASASHTIADVTDSVTSVRVSNSPRMLSKAAVQVPINGFTLGVEAFYVGSRLTLGGERLDGFFLPNITVTSPQRRISLQVGIYNAFDEQYADPGAQEHAQHAIAQDGRTVLARLKIAF